MPHLAAERLESRALLAVTATLDGGTLRIDLGSDGDVAYLSNDGTNYIVRGTGLEGFAAQNTLVNRVWVYGTASDEQSFTVCAGVGTVLSDSLYVDPSVEKTTIVGLVNTIGTVNINSKSITLAENVSTTSYQYYGGDVGLVGIRTLRTAGSSGVSFQGKVDSSPELFADPDASSQGDYLASAFRGIILENAGTSSSDVSAWVSFDQTSTTGPYAPTGNRVFAHTDGNNHDPLWSSDSDVLKATFDEPVTSVSLDFSPAGSEGVLLAYDAEGRLLDTASRPEFVGRFYTLTVSAPDIAYVIAGYTNAFSGYIDNLRATYATTPEAALIVNTTGFTSFNEAVGSTAPLAFLATDSGGATRLEGSVNTTAYQFFGDDVLVGSDIVITALGGVTFAGRVDTAYAGGGQLDIVAGDSPVRFAKAVGQTSALRSLWIRSAARVTAAKTIALDGSGTSLPFGLGLGAGVRNATMVAAGSTIRNYGSGFGMFIDNAVASRLSGFTVSNCNSGGAFATGTLTGTSISGSAFTANPVGVTLSSARGLWIGYGTIKDNTSSGIAVYGDSTGSSVYACAVSGSPTGILMSDAKGLVISGGNTVKDNSSSGIAAYGDCRGSYVIGSVLSNNGIGVIASNATGLQIGYSNGGGNTIVSNRSYGVYATGACDGTVIAGNTISLNPYGVLLSGARRLAVGGGNSIVSSSGAGVLATGDLTGTTLQGNVLDKNGCGLLMSAAAGLTVGGTGSAGNTIANSVGSGVLLIGACTGSTIATNWIGLNNIGIQLSGASGAVFSGASTVANNKNIGFYADGTCTGTTITGGIFAGNTTGLMIVAAKGLSISGTTVAGNKSLGLYATGVCTGTKVTGNSIGGNGINVLTSTATGGTFQTA